MDAILHRRTVARLLAERLGEAPVVRVTGPRAAGKTTTCEAEVLRRGGAVVRLDDPDERAAAAADPKGYLADLSRPVLIDEYQRVPAVLDVVKSDLSRRGSLPGQWVLCGSASIRAAEITADSLGGRLTDLTMGTLTLDERDDLPEPTLLARLATEGVAPLRGWRPTQPLDRNALLGEATRGGFPLITDRSSAASRRRGLEDWVSASVIADGAVVGGVRDVESLRRMVRLYAASTAAITPKDRPLAEQLEINRRTVVNYRDLLSALHVIWDVPAFVPGNARGQVVRSPKLHLIDSGLAAMLAGRDQPATLARDPAFAGALVETMVANDLRVQAAALDAPARLFHFRDSDHEVDLVIEGTDGSITGIEVKLAADPGERSLRGLRRLRDNCGDRWACGVVLCSVPVGRLTDDGLCIAPISAVWHF